MHNGLVMFLITAPIRILFLYTPHPVFLQVIIVDACPQERTFHANISGEAIAILWLHKPLRRNGEKLVRRCQVS